MMLLHLVFGRLSAQLEAKGEMIGFKDLQIASITLSNDLILVTHNKKEFQRIEGLKLEDLGNTTREIINIPSCQLAIADGLS